MLYFNLKRVFALRGIDRPYRWLVTHGFVPQTASRWANNEAGNIRVDQLERLCLALNCTPSDLFEWRDDGKTTVHDGHALRTLARPQPAKSVAELTRDIPADKLDSLGDLLATLRDGNTPNSD